MFKKLLQFIFGLTLLLTLTACQKPELFVTDDANVSAAPVIPAGEVAVLKDNIIVNQPLSNDVIASPLAINGRAKVADGNIFFRLKDANNQIIAQTSTAALDNVSDWGFYSGQLEFSSSTSPTGWLEIYTNNSQTGSEQNLVKLPIKFKEYQKPLVTVYFSNQQKDPKQLKCSQVYPVQREVEYTPQLIFRAIDQLLAGPTEAETQQGYFSNLPEKIVKAQKVEIKDGKVYVDFNQALQASVSGSCRVLAIRAQIIETLKLFSDISEVVISIDGETKKILQP